MIGRTRCHRPVVAAIAGIGILCSALVAGADEVADARAALVELGIRPLTANMALESEGTLHKELGKSLMLRRNLAAAEKELRTVEKFLANTQRTLTQLKQQHVVMSAQLARIDPNNIALNNKLVGALNATKGQHDLYEQQQEKLEEQLKNSRAKANEAREAYIQFVLDTRKLADRIDADYQAKPNDPAVKTAIDAFNKAAGKQLALTPTNALAANLRKLQQLEDTVLSEAIELTVEGGTLKVNVVVGGKHQQEMVVDSGASLISLPLDIAAKFGLRPSDKDPRLILRLADGREILGHRMTLPSVRVGKFTVEGVECAVLGPEATNAEPLLGMSFLGNFKFELDAAARTLTMVKVEGN